MPAARGLGVSVSLTGRPWRSAPLEREALPKGARGTGMSSGHATLSRSVRFALTPLPRARETRLWHFVPR